MFFFILLNNSVKLFAVLLSGILFGLVPLIAVATNGYILGVAYLFASGVGSFRRRRPARGRTLLGGAAPKLQGSVLVGTEINVVRNPVAIGVLYDRDKGLKEGVVTSLQSFPKRFAHHNLRIGNGGGKFPVLDPCYSWSP